MKKMKSLFVYWLFMFVVAIHLLGFFDDLFTSDFSFEDHVCIMNECQFWSINESGQKTCVFGVDRCLDWRDKTETEKLVEDCLLYPDTEGCHLVQCGTGVEISK